MPFFLSPHLLPLFQRPSPFPITSPVCRRWTQPPLTRENTTAAMWCHCWSRQRSLDSVMKLDRYLPSMQRQRHLARVTFRGLLRVVALERLGESLFTSGLGSVVAMCGVITVIPVSLSMSTAALDTAMQECDDNKETARTAHKYTFYTLPLLHSAMESYDDIELWGYFNHMDGYLQLCSISHFFPDVFSIWTYGYLDSLIFLAYKQQRLSFDQIPALADYDSAEQLVRKSFPALDPHNERASKHLLYGFLRVAFQFAGPIAMNRLLAYLENKGEGFIVRPWVWIASLFFIPFLRSILLGRYSWIATRTRTQAEGILLQLIFAHSLRIRMNFEAKDADARNLVGRINNLSTSDVANFTDVMDIWIYTLLFPLQVACSMWFLYLILGWSSFVGLAVILITLPLSSYLANTMRSFHISSRQKGRSDYTLLFTSITNTNSQTDARVQQVTETMNVVRMVKWFSWESKIKADIAAKREDELRSIRDIRLLTTLNNSINFLIPFLIMLATFSTYTLVMKQELTASIVFTSLAVFDGILRMQIRMTMNNIPIIVQGMYTELLDAYSFQVSPPHVPENSSKIGFRDAEFSWTSQENDTSYKLRIKSEVIFQPGVVNLIVGPTGVGKTAVLLALLGPNSWFNLPRGGGIAYTSQQPWIENATIKQNIVFDTSIPFDEARYNKVLYACALYPDLQLLDAGDETEWWPKALDVHTAKWIAQNCFSSDLIKGRTVILVTHNIALTRPVSQRIVSLSFDGRILQGSVDAVLKTSDTLAADVAQGQKALEEDMEPEDSVARVSGPTGKLIVEEKSQEGMASFCSTKPPPRFNFGSLASGPANMRIAPHLRYLGVYSATVILSLVLYIAAYIIYTFGTIRATKIIHDKLVDSVIGTTLHWLNTTPMSRVITRVTQDINKVDNNFARVAVSLIELTILFVPSRVTAAAISSISSMLAKFTAVMVLSPAFILPAPNTKTNVCCKIPYASTVCLIGRPWFFLSKLTASFAAAIAGLVSIRAYGAEKAFLQESTVRIDHFIRPAITFWNLNRWIGLRSAILGGIFSAALGWYLVYGGGSHHGAANVGFSVTMAVSFTSMVLVWIRVSNGMMLDERVAEYTEIEQEPRPTQGGAPPAYWPSSGELRAENLSAKYSDVTFQIKSGERIAIVGRTGSGKFQSSLTLALLRAIPTGGHIYYDDIPIDAINLDALRSNITIIPQVPELLGGTLRRNLDPFETHDDSVLNDALDAAGLFSLQAECDEKSITLDSVISSGGENLSVGQRQIVAFARAIVRESKLLLLDEGRMTGVIRVRL
ncbi:hypothetical protein C8R44DRAFT_729940 [Mycena epipterygia]|nr:hypothetical protein C8R44DRAFT_729940 [Mycena epipterygia]